MRQQLTQFIPKQPETYEADTTARDISRLVGAAGNLASVGVGIANANAQQELAKQQAIAKLSDDKRIADTRLESAKVDLANRRARFSAQSEDISRRKAEVAIDRIKDLEQHNVWSAVNGLSAEQLDSASAFNLGFRSPEAARAVNKAIGQRAAIRDMAQLQTLISTDYTKSGSEHLQAWLRDHKLDGDEPNLAYVETLTTRLADDLSSRQRREVAIEAQNNEYLVYDEMSHFAATQFDVATKDQIKTKLQEGYLQAVQTDPTLTEREFVDNAVAAMGSALVGPESRYSASHVLTKFGQLFGSEDEIENSGFGDIYARVKNTVVQQHQDESDGLFKLAKRQLAAAPSHESVNAIMTSAKTDDRLNGLQRQELQLLADDRLAEPDYMTEVQQRYGGDRSIAMTEAHEGAIAAFFGRKANNPNYTVADRLTDSASLFGRVIQTDIDAINSLTNSGDTREAVSRFATIRAANPTLARSLEGKVSDKAYSLSLLSSLGVADADKFIAEFDTVTEEDFATARSIVSNEKTEAGDKLDKLVVNSVRDLARKAVESKSGAVMDASVSQTYEQLVYAGIARTLASEGVYKPEELFSKADAFASTVLRRHVGTVKLGDDSYVLTTDKLRSYGFGKAEGQYLERVSELFRYKQNGLEDTFGADVVLDFSRASTITREGREWVQVPIRVEDALFGTTDADVFEFPKNSSSELQKLINAEKGNLSYIDRVNEVRNDPTRDPFRYRGRP